MSALPFTPAVSSAGWIAVSGQIGADADGALGPDVVAQTRLALANLRHRLRSQGADLDDVRDRGLGHSRFQMSDAAPRVGAASRVRSSTTPVPPARNIEGQP